MFFALSKLLTFVIMPLSWIILLLLASFLISEERAKYMLKLLSLALLLFFTNPLLVTVPMKWWEIEPMTYGEIDRKFKIGVVLTGMTDLNRLPDDRLHFNQSVDRINHSIELYRKGYIDQILISGGSGSLYKPNLKEAPKLKEYAIAAGIPSRKIIVESDSRNTHENASYSMRFLQERGLEKDTFLLITSAFHMRRAAACFNKQSGSFVPFTTGYQSRPLDWTPDKVIIPSLDAMINWHLLMREWVGMITYKLTGYI